MSDFYFVITPLTAPISHILLTGSPIANLSGKKCSKNWQKLPKSQETVLKCGSD
jgi:hypothetical protein